MKILVIGEEKAVALYDIRTERLPNKAAPTNYIAVVAFTGICLTCSRIAASGKLNNAIPMVKKPVSCSETGFLVVFFGLL